MLFQIEGAVFVQQLIYPLTHTWGLQHGFEFLQGIEVGGVEGHRDVELSLLQGPEQIGQTAIRVIFP